MARTTGSTTRTRFSIQLSAAVPFQVFTLPDPYRVIIDLPEVVFRLPPGLGARSHGLIKAFRYGLFAPGKSRVVLDAAGPVIIRQAAVVNSGRSGAELVIDLEATDEIGFLIRPPPKLQEIPEKTSVIASLRGPTRDARTRPVIVLDPGHGGVDAGSVGTSSSYEKNVTLAVARRVHGMLRAGGRYEVLMTRDTDTFVSLDDRVEFSRKHGAALFLSIHADAIADKAAAQSVRGATVYTLSEQASDEQARQLAEKENAADLAAGIQVSKGRKQDHVKTILIDLLRRETSNFSANFSKVLRQQLKGRIKLHKDARKAAAFHVLKQTRSPSVLIELGYMSNRADEQLMTSAKWQRDAARAIAKSVDLFFAGRVAQTR